MDFEGSGYGLTEGLPRGTEENNENLGTVSVPDEIQTEHLPYILTFSTIYFQNSELILNGWRQKFLDGSFSSKGTELREAINFAAD